MNQITHLIEMLLKTKLEVLLGATNVVVPIFACGLVYRDRPSALATVNTLTITVAKFPATITRTIFEILGYDSFIQFGCEITLKKFS